MCGIAGFCNLDLDYRDQSRKWENVLRKMNDAQKHRGPDDSGIYIDKGCYLAHVRLSIIDLKNGSQPMSRVVGNKKYTIVYNGEIYNAHELRDELEKMGAVFETSSDTEIILLGHLIFGQSFVKKLNGIFSYSIWDNYNKVIYLYRDRVGVKPLLYTFFEDSLIFSSEIKGILQYPKIKAKLDNYSVDLESNTITVNDLKTTSKPASMFDPEYFSYQRELGFYAYLLKLVAKKYYNLDKPEIKGNFLVVSTVPDYNTRVYPMTSKLFKSGWNECVYLLKTVAYLNQVKGYEF